MAKNKDAFVPARIMTTLGRETHFNGVMRFRESLKIDGSLDGEIHSKGYLYIEDGAVVTANIRVGSLVVGGVIKGNVEAADSVEMLATGRVYGNVRTGKLKIAEGVIFEGKCEMIRGPEKIDVFQAPVEQVKKAAQRI
jgi:cytoskeletal protein CcmA (bactofilin family)